MQRFPLSSRSVSRCGGKGDVPKSEQEWREIGDRAVNNIRHAMKRFHNRLTLDNPRFIERYIKRELQLVILFRIGDINEEFCAYLQREQAVSGDNIKPFAAASLGRPDTNRAESAAVRNQSAVLVSIVKSMETPKRVIPTLIWFDRIDRVHGLLPHALYFSARFGFVFHGAIGNRKSSDADPWSTASSDHELPRKMIKGAPHILKGVSRNASDVRGSLFSAGDVINQLSCLRITLSSDSIGVGLSESPNCLVQLVDVMFGPF